MRILHVNKFLYRRGGAEAYMQDVAELQRAAGHEVAYFGMAHPDNDPCEYERFFPSYVELEPPPPSLSGKARAAARMVWSRESRRGMEQTLAAFRPDVVHLHNIYHQLSPSILRPVAARRLPAVMTLHDYKLACPTYQFLDHGHPCRACVGRKFHNAPLKRCKDDSLAASGLAAFELALHTFSGAYGPTTRFICPSRFLKDAMAEASVYPDRLRHVPHFVTTDGVPAKTAPGGGVVFAGRLAPEKGVDVLLDAAAKLPDVDFDIAGDGPSRPELETVAAKLPNVTFHGRLDRARVLDLVRGASVAAVPSRWYENQPMTVLEGMACGVAVVTTTLGGLPELVEPDVTGALVAPNDADALARAIAALVQDPDRAFEMGRVARERIVTEFSPAAHLRNVHAVYDEAAAAVRSGA
jgi:glycosyltransferase involved in cell wall biosynthesis